MCRLFFRWCRLDVLFICYCSRVDRTVDEQIRQFINSTLESEDKRDWKERLLKPETGDLLRLDLMFVGGQSLSDIILGHVTDKALDPSVIEAYRLQYPELSHQTSFVHEVQKLAGDPDRLRGFFSGVKGKLFEVEYRDYLNHGHLPAGYIAELSAKANEPGVDILIKDDYGHVHEQLQAKAFETLAGVKEHIERYPNITPVIIPHDQVELANTEHLGGFIEGAPSTTDHLNDTVHHAIDQSVVQAGVHLPWVGFSFMAGEVAYLLWKGKPVSFEKIVKRGTKMTIAAVAGQIATMVAHSTWVGIPVAVTTRILLERYTKAVDFIHWLEAKRKWANSWALSRITDSLAVAD